MSLNIIALFKQLSSRVAGCFLLAAALFFTGCATGPQTPVSKVRIDIQQDVGFTITEAANIGGKARENYELAQRMLVQQRYNDGIALLEQLVESEPQLSAPRIDLAIAYRLAGDIELAEQHLSEALGMNPQHPVALNEMGIVYRKTGRFSEARSSYEQALSVYPGFHSARRNLAVLCDLYIGDFECALRNYEAYMETVADDPEVTIWMADIRSRSGN